MAEKDEEDSNVVFLGPHDNMTVNEALSTASRAGFKEMIIFGYDQEGAFCTYSSGMTRKDALWLLEHAKTVVTRPINDQS